MTTFSYQARTAAGELISGLVDAEDRNDAGRRLRGEGKFIVKLETASARDMADADSSPPPRRKICRDDVIYFAHQMSVMIETGVTLGEALESISEQCPNPSFRKVLEQVSGDVQAGSQFSAALARHPKVFPKLMISLLKASEASGTMGKMMARISAYLGKERQTAQAVRGAMIYPLIMAVVAMLVTVFLLVVVLPRFSTIYASRGALLPAPTRLLLFISEMATSYWYVGVIAIIAAVMGASYARTTERGRLVIDWLKINTPVIGPMMRQLYVTRAMRTMGTMISAGVPMLDLIAICRAVTDNVYFARLWDRVDEGVRQGVQLSATIDDSDLIPTPIVRMIHSGEKAGRVGEVLDRVAEFTEQDFDEAVKRTTRMVEPAMVAFMGLLIGFVAISLLLPIFSIGRVMSGS